MSKKLAFIFPGQGSQTVGMGYDFAQEFPEFKPIFQKYLSIADQKLGFKLSQIIETGPAEELKKTEITQPALLTVSSAMAEFQRQKGVVAHLALGHSLGEYSALVYAGALDFSDAIHIVHKRGKFMSEAVPYGQGGMAALVGASVEDAQKLCEISAHADEVLQVSVFNCPGQIVVSGSISALERAEKNLPQVPGIRKLARLEVSGPFHCRLLEGAGTKLRDELQKVKMKSPKLPVIFNVTSKSEADPVKMIELLVNQVSKPVLWEASIREAIRLGTEDFQELGNGKVLSGLLRKIL